MYRRNESASAEIEKFDNSIMHDRLIKFYRCKKHVDCKFLVGPNKKPFEAHKLLLALASDVFEALLYSQTSGEPILLPDVDPKIFEIILRYIYFNIMPHIYKDDDIIKLWYAACTFELLKLSSKFGNEIKINLKNMFLVYDAAKMLREQLSSGHTDAKIFILKCQKLFSVKTEDALDEDGFTEHIKESFLKDLFALDYMNIASELELFKALAHYAHSNGWIPTGDCFLDEDENGKSLETPFQKHIRDALKQIRFLRMTLKDFDSVISKSGFLTESEVKAIRHRIAEDSAPCVSLIGFSKLKEERRELLKIKLIGDMEKDEHNKHVVKQAFDLEFPKEALGVSEPLSMGNLNWHVIIYKREAETSYLGSDYEHTVYLKCDGSEIKDWRCYAQLDLEYHIYGDKRFDNIPWYCFKCNAKYSQSGPMRLSSKPKITCQIAISPRRVSLKNKESNVCSVYGSKMRDYE